MTARSAARRVPSGDTTYSAPEWDEGFLAGAVALLRRDPALAVAIDAIGPCTLRPEPRPFPLLVSIIISQQISVKAARSIARRLRGVLPANRFTPQGIARLTDDELRAVGLTRTRATAISELAHAALTGRVRLTDFRSGTDAEVIAALLPLRGIGRWTAEMLLIFGYGRPDVFPDGDLGVRKGIAELYRLPALPTPATCRTIAEAWRPFRSVAAWYLWRFADKSNATLGLSRYPV